MGFKNTTRWTIGTALVLVTVLASWPAAACEPILPLMVATGSPVFVLKSVVWLAIAVVVKSLAFAAFSRGDLQIIKALVFMLLANVVSTLVGLFLATTAANPPAFLITLPLLVLIALPPANRLSREFKRGRGLLFALLIVALLVITWFLFGFSQKVALEDDWVAYWAIKFGYATVAIVISMALTSLWEEWVIARLSTQGAQRNFYVAVFRANAVTLILVMGVAAIRTLPERLGAEGFLAQAWGLLSRLV
ncbi:hypothetical protein KAI87_17885 [Myxococcota bacterium]|nr:hypothetical protein [Myxococcota bacterium]